MTIKHTKVNGVKVPICVRCDKPVKVPDKVTQGDKPVIRVICNQCMAERGYVHD